MHEVALCDGQIDAFAKQRDFVADTAVAQMRHTQPCRQFFWKRRRGKITAAGLDHQPYDRAGIDIQHATRDQVLIHDGVEIRIKHDVVEVAVGVVVTPACIDGQMVRKLAAPEWGQFCCGFLFPFSHS